MQRIMLSAVALLMVGSAHAEIQKNPLPNWIDHSREQIQTTEKFTDKALNYPPAQTYRLPAEYEPAQAVVVGWMAYSNMLRDIARVVSNETGAEIWVVDGPSSISGVDKSKQKNLRCGLDTVWMRDYGPFTVSEKDNSIGVVDTVYRHWQYRRRDDRLPQCVANKKGIENYGMDLVLDGGNLIVDSVGNLFTTTRTYIWNRDKSPEEVDRLLMEYFGAKKVHVVEYAGHPGSPADGTGHIDMFVKLLNDNTVLISTANREPFKSAIAKTVKYFESIKAPNGDDYKIIRVKGWSNYRTWYTYTNSLIVNNHVLMPAYRGKEKDTQAAIKAYEEGMPGVKVHPIYSDDSIRAGGSIHCVTQLVPKKI